MMTDRLFIRPAPGLLVRDPDTLQPVPESGMEVERNPFWLRRLHEGDVVEGLPLTPTPAPKSKAQTKE